MPYPPPSADEAVMQRGFLVLLFLAGSACSGNAREPVPPPLHPKESSAVTDDPGPGVDINYQTNRITRRDPAGRVLWTLELSGNLLGSHREPHALHDANRLYLSHAEGITALDSRTGKLVWHAKGPGDRLYLKGRLLLATECSCGADIVKQGRWLIARATDTGAQVFKVALPASGFDPWPIREVTGLFLVQACDLFSSKGTALLIDQQGKVCHRFDRPVLDGMSLGEDRVFLTSHNIFRVRAAGKEVWSIRLDQREDLDGGGLVAIPGGDLLSFQFGGIHDSGVCVLRIDPRKGKVAWMVKCAPLGVGHSKYRHQATVRIDGQRVRVTSRGSFGSFVEVLDLKTGKQLAREGTKLEE
jgi:outer membrane protein assembly factor BamB